MDVGMLRGPVIYGLRPQGEMAGAIFVLGRALVEAARRRRAGVVRGDGRRRCYRRLRWRGDRRAVARGGGGMRRATRLALQCRAGAYVRSRLVPSPRVCASRVASSCRAVVCASSRIAMPLARRGHAPSGTRAAGVRAAVGAYRAAARSSRRAVVCAVVCASSRIAISRVRHVFVILRH